MKITIAGRTGVLLQDPDGEIQDLIDRHQSLEDLCPFGDQPNYFSDSRQNATDATATIPTGYGVPNSEYKPGRWRLNSLYWPATGACRYGVGIFHVSEAMVGVIASYQGAVPVVITDGLATVTAYLYPLPLRKLARNSYIFVGVDDRYRWQYCDLGDLDLTYSSTWASLFSTLETRLGITFSPAVAVAAEYETPNFIEFQRKHQNAAAALDAAAASVGQRVVVQVDGTVSLQKATDAEPFLTARAADPFVNLSAGGLDTTNTQIIPASVKVVFPRYQSGAPQSNGDTWDLTYAGSGTLNGIKVFNCSADADFASDPDAASPDNSTALNTLGTKISEDFYLWADLGSYDYSIARIEPVDLVGTDDFIWYVIDRIPPANPLEMIGDSEYEEPDDGFIVQTRLVSLPLNYGVENILAAFATRRYTPIGIHRAVLSAAIAPGSPTTGYLLYDNAGTITADSREIQIYDPFDKVTAAAGEEFWVTGPMRDTNHFEIVSAFSTGVIRFRLTGTLSNGGNATANILTFNGAAYNAGAATIYVFDWWAIATGLSTRGMYQGVSGMEGLAIRRETPSVGGHDEYDIIWMEQYAWDAEVTLTANPTFSGGTYTSSWTATADVDAAFHQGITPGASITVHDDQVMFPFAKSGAKAKVIRSEYEASAPYYKLIQCQQVALTGKATLSGAMCGEASADIVDFVVTSPSPFNLDVSPTIANNPRGHAGEHGNEVWLAWNTVAAAYEIIDMELRGVGVIVGLRQQDDILQGNYRTIYVERCGATDYWLDIMPMHAFNWWCSGNYYQYCSGSLVSGSGSGSGTTGATCDCTTLPSTLTLTFHGGPACLFGQSVTLTKSGSTWSWSGTIAGDSWAFDWECFSTATGELGGTLTVTYPACIQSGSPASPAALSALGGSSCDPPHIEFDAIYFSGMSGCSTCPDSMMGGSLLFAITA